MPSQNNMDTLKSVLKKILGAVFIIIGIAGLFLPFLQGIALIITGIIFLGNHKLIVFIQHLRVKTVTFAKKLFNKN